MKDFNGGGGWGKKKVTKKVAESKRKGAWTLVICFEEMSAGLSELTFDTDARKTTWERGKMTVWKGQFPKLGREEKRIFQGRGGGEKLEI